MKPTNALHAILRFLHRSLPPIHLPTPDPSRLPRSLHINGLSIELPSQKQKPARIHTPDTRPTYTPPL